LSSYILSKLYVEVPETYREIVRKIRNLGIIDESLEKKLQGIVGLRNIIVHMYADVKGEIIHDTRRYYRNTQGDCQKTT
jgi:uncharacterized protein YutE (UPF0331/DUF86 family)